MALVKCKECKKEISSKVKKCPHCGAKRGLSGFSLFLIILAGLIVLGNVAGNDAVKRSAVDETEAPAKNQPKKIADIDNWQVVRDVSEMTNTKTVVIATHAQNSIQAWLRETTPILYIRCKENKTELYINNGTAAQPEYGSYNSATVRLRIGDGKAYTEQWSESTDNEALFAPRSVSLIKELAKAKKFLFEFTPHNANPQTVRFDLRGIEKHIVEIAATCGWTL